MPRSLCRVSDRRRALGASVFAPAHPLAAHDIPSDATVQMFFKPAGNHLNILVRVPLKTMRDIEFPERDQGYLDLDRVDPTLREAASLWLSDFIDVYEGDALLPKPRSRGDAPLAGIRPVVRVLRAGARACHRPEAHESHDHFLGPVDAGRALRVSHPIGPLTFLDSSRRSTGWPRG